MYHSILWNSGGSVAAALKVNDGSNSKNRNNVKITHATCAFLSFQNISSSRQFVCLSRSISMAKDRLETMPCGGGSPLAHGLSTAIRVGLKSISAGNVGRVMVVCLTDGRANVPLSESVGSTTDDMQDGENSTRPTQVLHIEKVCVRRPHCFDTCYIPLSPSFPKFHSSIPSRKS